MKLVVTIAVFFTGIACALAQDITGYWRSEDGTRIYHVYHTGNGVEASLFSSARKSDANKTGVTVLSNVRQQKQGWYGGFIHAVSDGLATIARIRLIGANSETLQLRLSRWVLPVHITWYRVKQ